VDRPKSTEVPPTTTGLVASTVRHRNENMSLGLRAGKSPGLEAHQCDRSERRTASFAKRNMIKAAALP